MNFFEAFGLNEEEILGTSPKKQEKKEEKKQAAKKTGGGNGKSQDFDVALPVTVKGRNFTRRFERENAESVKASALWEELQKEIPQFGIADFELVYVSALHALYVCDDGLKAEEDEAGAFPDADGGDSGNGDPSIMVSDGDCACILTPADFAGEGLDPEEITLGDVRDRFVRINPEYEGCSLSFDAGAKVAYPVFAKLLKEKPGEIVTVNVNGNTDSYEMQSGTPLAERIEGEITGVSPRIVAGEARSFLSYSNKRQKGETCYSKKTGSQTTVKARKAEKKYSLPMELYVTNFNVTYELTPEMFGGQERAGVEDITKAMASVEPLFSDPERKVEYLYNEKKQQMTCMFISGRKG